MDWKNEAKAARERVAFLFQQNLKFMERCKAADNLAKELEKYNHNLDMLPQPPLMHPRNAEIEAIRNYHRIAKEVEKELESN